MAEPGIYSELIVVDLSGIWDADVRDALTPREGETGTDKTRDGARYYTDLGVDRLRVGGFTSNVCTDSLLREALFRDLRLVVHSDDSALDGVRHDFGQFVTADVLVEDLARVRQAPA